MTQVRAYLAMSLDGFVAGPYDALDWLEPRGSDAAPVAAGSWSDAPDDALEFAGFLAQVGCIVMGRRTYDVAAAFPEWPYGDVPMLVATHRPLAGARSATPTSGDLAGILAAARALAGEGDVYLDGASMVRAALDGGLLDEIVVTIVPVVLGAGVALFAHASRTELTVERVARYGDGLVQLHLRPG